MTSSRRAACYRLLQASAQILEDLLFAMLKFERNRLRHSGIVLSRMDFPRPPEVFSADSLCTRCTSSISPSGLNHSSSCPQYRVFERSGNLSSGRVRPRSSIPFPMESRAQETSASNRSLARGGIEDISRSRGNPHNLKVFIRNRRMSISVVMVRSNETTPDEYAAQFSARSSKFHQR